MVYKVLELVNVYSSQERTDMTDKLMSPILVIAVIYSLFSAYNHVHCVSITKKQQINVQLTNNKANVHKYLETIHNVT